MKNEPNRQELEALVRCVMDGRYPEAVALSTALTTRFPLHGFGWKVLGVALRQMGRSKEALEPLKQAAALMPTDADAHMNLAATLHGLGQLHQAEDGFRHALRIQPEFAEANYCLGNTLRDLGQLQEAAASYRRALQVRPDFVEAHSNLAVILQQSGQLEDAAASYRRVLQVTPACPDTNYNLGNVLRDLGRMAEAEASYRLALREQPDFPEAYSNLGFVLQALGRLDEAVAACRKATEIIPDGAYAHFNLARMLQDLGRFEEATHSYRRAIERKHDFADAYNNLGATLDKQGLRDEAVANYRKALEINPGFVDAHCNLASVLNEIGRLDAALVHFNKALDGSPTLLAARLGKNSTLSRLVPQWHVPMMNDQRRNNAYFAALESAITPESTVFEIGSGAGLLSMMSAKLRAKVVTTCETVPLIAETARRIVADNGYQQTIRVIAKQSTDVRVGDDLSRQADILVSEVFSSELLGEGVLPSIEDAKRRLLKPRGRVIPASGSIMIALLGDGELTRNVFVEDAFGFKLGRFNSIISEKQVIARNDLEVKMLSKEIEAFRFDFQHDSCFPGETKTLHIPLVAPGRCYGLIQWIRLQLDAATRFENHPAEPSPVSNWQHCTYIFAEPVDVKPGQIVLISASHNRIVPWFSLQGIRDSNP
ncbi:MAG: tetratricopeptide repeat protein [Sterolibacterium sp.]|jgi:tetratricopeptide (TPR) repeat protein